MEEFGWMWFEDPSGTSRQIKHYVLLLGQHVSILIESSSGPSKKIDPYLDSIRIETCCPNKKHNKGLLCLTDTSLNILYTC